MCVNLFSEQFLDADSFANLEEVWRWGWDEELGTVPPRTVTDTAIDIGRRGTHDRLIVHYMQPHTPFLESAHSPALDMSNFTGEGARTLDDWEFAEMGERDIDAVWDDYRDNLRIVLDDIDVLRTNLYAETLVVTSDHGMAAGEHGLYGHPGGIAVPVLREVPWCETSATNTGEHETAS